MNTIAEPGSSTGSAAAATRKCARALIANVWSHWAALVPAIPRPSPMPTFSTSPSRPPSAAQWDQTFAVNTRAHFLVAAAALPVLEPGSAIVFISSAASLRAATGIPAYDASKAALLGLCRQVAREGMAQGIRANLVVPGLVDTPLGREASRLNPGRTARALPFGRQATAWEVAYAAVWLLSGEASYVNAHPLILDGGATSFG